MQVPVAEHVVFCLQAGGELQKICVPVHTPPWHESGDVQASLSLQPVPLGALVGVEQMPVDGLQTPATLHMTDVEHVTGLAPTHAPD